MDNTTARYWFLKVAQSLIHTPYHWSGDDPTGFDCSGLVVECLKSVGRMPAHDATADDLWRRFHQLEVVYPTSGCLAFWFNAEGEAYHVAICLDARVCLTADGGGSQTQTLADAIEQNAFVKIRPIDHRSTAPKFLDLFQTITL